MLVGRNTCPSFGAGLQAQRARLSQRLARWQEMERASLQKSRLEAMTYGGSPSLPMYSKAEDP